MGGEKEAKIGEKGNKGGNDCRNADVAAGLC